MRKYFLSLLLVSVFIISSSQTLFASTQTQNVEASTAITMDSFNQNPQNDDYDISNVHQLIPEDPRTRGISVPTTDYDMSLGTYDFEYSNNAVGNYVCYSAKRFTNCNSTMYLRINDTNYVGQPGAGTWYYNVYCNGSSIGSYGPFQLIDLGTDAMALDIFPLTSHVKKRQNQFFNQSCRFVHSLQMA